MNPKIYDYLKLSAIILLVVALGLTAINQGLGYYYKVHFLKSPCHLCSELNKNQSTCLKGCFEKRVSLYPDGFGRWKDIEGNQYDSTGNKINDSGYIFNP